MIHLEDLAEEMDAQFEETDTFLHKTKGEFIYLDTEYYALAEEVDLGGKELTDCQDWEREAVAEIIKYWEHSEEYLSIPDRYEINEYKIMEEFIEQLADPSIQDQLAWAIRGRGAFRLFKDRIAKLGISQKWYSFKEQCLLEITKDWCEENGVAYQRKEANR